MPGRHVRRLRLRVPSDDHVARTTALLTDALRTATLPGGDAGTFVVIRRLSVGRIATNISSGALALLLERAAADVAASAVAFDSAEAVASEAVVFPGKGTALVALASRHAQCLPSEGWFWSAVVEGWHSTPDRAARWRLLLDCASRETAAAVILASIAAGAVAMGRESELLGSIRNADAVRWMALCGWPPVEQSLAQELLPLRVAQSAVLSRCAAAAGPHDMRVVWLATALAVDENPGRATDATLPARAAAYLRSVVFQLRVATRPDVDLPAVIDGAATPSAPDSIEMRLPSRPGAARPPVKAHRRAARESDGSRDIEGVTPAAGGPLAAAGPDGRSTAFAGLLFVVPILARCGFADRLQSHLDFIERRLPERLLGYIARRGGIAEDDPFAALFPYEPGDDPGELRAWMNVVRRWCRRHADLGLLALIRRRGRVFASDTHLDVMFDLSQIDVRVRRVALDVNPGWVPWLGRVIQFTYTNSHDRAR